MGKEADKIAFLVPCYNEAATVGKVIEDIKKYLPEAVIYVYDNVSTDDTVAVASSYDGVIVKTVNERGKGNVVRTFLNDVVADYYFMVDGDATYGLENLGVFYKLLLTGKTDMVIGNRMLFYKANMEFSNVGRYFFNRFLSNLYSLYFGEYVPDVLSGFRGFNRSIVDFVNLESKEFEIESELSFKVYMCGFYISYLPVMYLPERNVPDSFSKIKPFRDGFTILKKTFVMMMGWEC